ncbi:hypothetical protein, partial [Streptomyces sp. NPDC056227]|uniref:hypothetical protein n=1 Tax=Streptomyces sp. NPDC056227 TaxID=3345753 RepID=UPI0035DF16C6
MLHQQAREAHRAAATDLEKFVPAVEPLTFADSREAAQKLDAAREALHQAKKTERARCLEEAAIGRKADRAESDAALQAQTANILSAAAARHEEASSGAGTTEESARDLTDAILP